MSGNLQSKVIMVCTSFQVALFGSTLELLCYELEFFIFHLVRFLHEMALQFDSQVYFFMLINQPSYALSMKLVSRLYVTLCKAVFYLQFYL